MPDEQTPLDSDDLAFDEIGEMVHRLHEAGISPLIVSQEEAGLYFTPDEVADLREMLAEWRKQRPQDA